jgi:hypothetical protein
VLRSLSRRVEFLLNRQRHDPSGCIERPRAGGDLLPTVRAQVFGGAQLDRPTERAFELQLHLSELEETRNVVWMELDEEVDVAGGSDIAQSRPIEGEAPNSMCMSERGEDGASAVIVGRGAEPGQERGSRTCGGDLGTR